LGFVSFLNYWNLLGFRFWLRSCTSRITRQGINSLNNKNIWK
jgi:hypothetical protein